MVKYKLSKKEKIFQNLIYREDELLDNILGEIFNDEVLIIRARTEIYNDTTFINAIIRLHQKKKRCRIIFTICSTKEERENAIECFSRRICNCDKNTYPKTIYDLIIINDYQGECDKLLKKFSIKLPNDELINKYIIEINLSALKSNFSPYIAIFKNLLSCDM